MPVWHEATAPWRADGRLVVVGVVQEQHRERCRLYAQWRGFDWPILWDPLNLTGARAVPSFLGIDEHGVVRWNAPRPDGFAERFLDVEFDPPAGGNAVAPPPVSRTLLADPARGGMLGPVHAAHARLLWGGPAELDGAIAVLEDDLDDPLRDPRAWFRLGVAYRLRVDSPARRPGDFQRALDAWGRALARDPDQYVWRRRIQQYGPRLDKPYPFYGWVAEARAAIAARGETPVELTVPLTGSERAGAPPPAEADPAPAVEPDPEGRVRRDPADWLVVETAVARDTGGERGGARVHVTLRPREGAGRAWNNEGEPLTLWVDAPEGWTASPRLVVAPGAAAATSREARTLDFEVAGPPGARAELGAHALYSVCEEETGRCTYVRRDLRLAVDLAAP